MTARLALGSSAIVVVAGVLVAIGFQRIGAPPTIVAHPPVINVGNECGFPTQDKLCTGGTTTAGLHTGHIAIGNNIPGTNAYVGMWGDETYRNPNQEMRGLSYALRTSRSTPDEQSLGWDIIPVVAASVIESSNTQRIVGNVKSLVAETYFDAPSSGSYRVRNSYNLQSTIVTLGKGVTLENWQGLVVSSTPKDGGTINRGFGIQIGSVHAETAAALKIDGTDDSGRILWTNWAAVEKSDANLHFQWNGNNTLTLTPTSADFAQSISATLRNESQASVVCYGSATKQFTYRPWSTGCSPSSLRFKEQIENLENPQALSTVLGLRPKRYRFKASTDADQSIHIGFLAEDVAATAPDLVEYEVDGKTPRAVRYQDIIPLLAGAIQELKLENNSLRQEIKQLKAVNTK